MLCELFALLPNKFSVLYEAYCLSTRITVESASGVFKNVTGLILVRVTLYKLTCMLSSSKAFEPANISPSYVISLIVCLSPTHKSFCSSWSGCTCMFVQRFQPYFRLIFTIGAVKAFSSSFQ